MPPMSLLVHDWFSGGVRSSDGTLVLNFSLRGVSNSFLLAGVFCLSVSSSVLCVTVAQIRPCSAPLVVSFWLLNFDKKKTSIISASSFALA